MAGRLLFLESNNRMMVLTKSNNTFLHWILTKAVTDLAKALKVDRWNIGV